MPMEKAKSESTMFERITLPKATEIGNKYRQRVQEELVNDPDAHQSHRFHKKTIKMAEELHDEIANCSVFVCNEWAAVAGKYCNPTAYNHIVVSNHISIIRADINSFMKYASIVRRSSDSVLYRDCTFRSWEHYAALCRLQIGEGNLIEFAHGTVYPYGTSVIYNEDLCFLSTDVAILSVDADNGFIDDLPKKTSLITATGKLVEAKISEIRFMN